MMQIEDDTTGHVIADYDGKLMLVNTAAATTFFDEHQGVRISDLARRLGQPLDGVLGMDSLRQKVVRLTRDGVQFDASAPTRKGARLSYAAGVPCVDIRINEMPCRAAINTAATASYVSHPFISRDTCTRTVNERHPYFSIVAVEMYVNYFSIGNKNFFADAGELPEAFASLSSTCVDAVLGTDLLERFDLIMDFSANRLHLVSS